MSNSVVCVIMMLHLHIYSKYERRVPVQPVAFISPIAWMGHQSLSYQMLSREILRNIFSFISDFIAVCASMWRKKKSERGGGSGPSYLLEVWEGSGLLACSS